MLSADKTGLLKAFLGSLPGHVAARLAKAIEIDRLMDGKMPHEDILTGLRPVLRREPQIRTPTPQRLFCLPFQDLLDSVPRKTKQKGVIARSSVGPVWQWLSATLLPEETRAYCTDIKQLALSANSNDALARAGEFWTLAALTMNAALAETKKARKALGDDMIAADAGEMALLLAAAPALLKVQALMPSPSAMSDELLWELRAIYEEMAAANPDAAPYIGVVVMNRLSRPWEALRLLIAITRQHGDTLISQTDLGLVGEILFGRLDTLQAQIKACRHPNFNEDLLLEQTRQFAELSTSVTKEMAVRREGEWGQRLLRDRVQIGQVMDGLMERAPREVAAALPMHRGAGKMADFSRAVDADKKTLARRYARLVSGSRKFAAGACFGAKQKDALEELCSYLRRYNEDVVRELRAPGNPGVVESQFQFATELTAILFSEEEAELMRRRGKAAQAA